MPNSKSVALGGLCVSLAVIFQLVPVFYSEVFVLITALSALPIYIISRLSPKMGFITFLIAGLIIFEISAHESLFFFLANGPVGLSLGLGSYYLKKRSSIVLISGISLSFTLMILNFLIGIPVFGFSLPGVLLIKVSIIFLFSLLYCYLYLHICIYIYNLISKSLSFFSN